MLELDDDDKAILAELLRETIERDRFPLSPRVRSFQGDPGEARPANTAAGAAAAAETARRAQHGADEEAAAIGERQNKERLLK
jgi:hypothetical protein